MDELRAGAAVVRKGVEAIRASPPAKTLDQVIEGLEAILGTSGKAWLANGLDELRQAVALGSDQIQAGNNPGLWGTITTGEATAERMEGERMATLRGTYEVPEQQKTVEASPTQQNGAEESRTLHGQEPKQFSMEYLREFARELAKAAEERMDRGHEQDHGRGR